MAMYKNILVINLLHIGDLLLVTPILRTLRSNYPNARLTLLADKKLRDLVEYNKHIDECMFIDKKGEDDGFFNILRYIGKIRKKKFDLVINLHRNERASAIAAFSGAKKIVGYSKPFFSLYFSKVLPNQKEVMHQVHSHFEVLEKAVGIKKIDDGGLEMELPPNAKEKALKLWKENFCKEDKVIGLNIGASWLTKRWIDSYFAEVADYFIKKGYKIAFFGGPMDKEIVAAAREMIKEGTHKDIAVFTGKVSLGELAALLEECVLVISTDSGPMHVAVSRHVPVVTMFGASAVLGFYPYDERDILLKTPEKCHPCGIHECPLKGERNMACMKNIPPSEVIKYSEELLERYEKKVGKMKRAPGYKCRVIEL